MPSSCNTLPLTCPITGKRLPDILPPDLAKPHMKKVGVVTPNKPMKIDMGSGE